MKYVELIKDGNNYKAIPLGIGEFYETKTGELLQTVKGKILKTLRYDQWALYDDAPRPSAKLRKRSTPSSTFMRPLITSTELRAIVRFSKGPRTKVIKCLWDFIKENKLQDNLNRRMINVGQNELTKALFKVDKISMFEMTKVISKHLFQENGKTA